jgi:hypothetical protein
MVQQKFDPKWLEGLKFHYANKKIVEKNGRKTLQAIPMERPLKEEDLLELPNGERSWRDLGDKVVIVTKDGRKYTVEKNPKPKKEPETKGQEKG